MFTPSWTFCSACSSPQVGANHAGRRTQVQATQTDVQPAVQAGAQHIRAVGLSSSGPAGQLQLLDEQAGTDAQSEAAEEDAASGSCSARAPQQLEELYSAPEQQQARHSVDAASAGASETAAAEARTGQVPASVPAEQATSPPDSRPPVPAGVPDSDSAVEHIPGLRQGAADPPVRQLWHGGSSALARHASPVPVHRSVPGPQAGAAAPSPSVALRAARQELPPDEDNSPHWDEVGTPHSSFDNGYCSLSGPIVSRLPLLLAGSIYSSGPASQVTAPCSSTVRSVDTQLMLKGWAQPWQMR